MTDKNHIAASDKSDIIGAENALYDAVLGQLTRGACDHKQASALLQAYLHTRRAKEAFEDVETVADDAYELSGEEREEMDEEYDPSWSDCLNDPHK